MKIKNCKTNHLTSPMGYQMDVPVFSWQVEAEQGKYQQCARVRVSEYPDMAECCFDSGMRPDIDSLAYSVDMELKPRTRYYWTVKVITDARESAESPVNWFETGKRREPWSARWITCKEGDRHPVFERRIQVGEGLSAARLYICGLGAYRAEIDGKPVSGEFLTPYCNNYHAWLQYQTIDVTEHLVRGGLLRVALGNGWYLSRFGFFSKPGDTPYYGQEMKLIAEVHLRYEDGREEVVCTDESWDVRRSRITFSGIYDGEYRDDTLPETEGEPVSVTQESTPLVERYSIPAVIHEEISPAELLHTPAGELVLDMGQNLAGIFRIQVRAKAGTKVHLSFGEVLQEGNFYRDNLRTALAEYTYISDGTEREVRPEFTFFGYRYVKVEGLPDLEKTDFTALAVYSGLPVAGSLKTGHEKVNRLIQNAEWGLKGNFLDVPTDCPQRDERMGWTGDAQVFSPTACFLRDSYAFYRKYVHDLATEQEEREGGVPDVVPSFGYPTAASVWGDAACIIPWNLYLFYGDVKILEEQFDSMKAWVEYVRRIDGRGHGWRKVYHNGDWLALDHPRGGEDQCLGGTDEGYIADIYYANSAKITAKAAELLGREEDAKEYGELAEKIRREIREEFFSPRGRCCVNTQTGLLLALQFDLAPDREAIKHMLEKKFKDTKGKLQTGFVGTPFLCRQLTRIGMEHLAYDLLLNEEYPGWLYEVNLGATTVWERWNSLNADGSVSSTGMNSFNHYSYGSIVEWMYRDMAGLNPVEESPGFRLAEIRPVPDMRIGHLAMSYESPAGRYEVGWTAEDEWHLRLRIRIPFGCRAVLTLPYAPEKIYGSENPIFEDVRNGKCHLHAGTYEISYRTAQPLRRIYSCEDTVEELLEKEETRTILESFLPGVSHAPDFIRKMKLREAAGFGKSGFSIGDRLDELEKVLNRAAHGTESFLQSSLN